MTAKDTFLGTPLSEWQALLSGTRLELDRGFLAESQTFFDGVLNLMAGQAAPAPPGAIARDGATVGRSQTPTAGAAADPAIAEVARLADAMGDSSEDASKRIVAAKKREVAGKKLAEDSYSAATQAVQQGLRSGVASAAQDVGSSFSGLIVGLREGSVNLGETFQQLAGAMAKSIINAVGDALIQKGAGKAAEGLASVIVGDPRGGQEFAAAGILAAAGGAIKGVAAAFLAEGGLVTRPTLAYVGEGGQSEAVVPLDRLAGMKVGGGQISFGKIEVAYARASISEPDRGKKSRSLMFAELQQESKRRIVERQQPLETLALLGSHS
jgi:hypothetical protein